MHRSRQLPERSCQRTPRLQSWFRSVDRTVPSLDDALLIVSELVSNVVAHTTSSSVVTAAFDDHRLRIEVHDRDPRGPSRRSVRLLGVGVDRVRHTCVDRDAVLSSRQRTRRHRHRRSRGGRHPEVLRLIANTKSRTESLRTIASLGHP